MKKATVVLFALTLLAVTFAWAENVPQGPTVLSSAAAFETSGAQVTSAEIEPFWVPTFLRPFETNFICPEPGACTVDRDCVDGPESCNNPTGQLCAGTCQPC